MNPDPKAREAARSTMARIVELVSLPGFELLPPREQDYLIDLVVCEAHGNDMPYPPPWHEDSLA